MESFPLLCLFLFLSFSLALTEEENVLTMNINVETPVVNGLSAWTFYNTACPKLYSLIHQRIKLDLQEDVIQAAEMLCLHFHNCFVQGCDGSVPLDGPASEQDASPNLTQTFEIVNDIIALTPREYPVSEISAGTMDRMLKGRRLQQDDHRSKREPPKPPLNRGHDGQHD